MLRKLIAGLTLAAVLTSQAMAIPISRISPYDRYYLSQVFENELVTVLYVDYRSNSVKIRHRNGYTQWVSPNRLLSYEESFGEDAATTVIGIALLVCLMSPEACSE